MALPAGHKEKNIWRSFTKAFKFAYPNTPTRKVIYGSQLEAAPEALMDYVEAGVKQVIVIQPTFFAGRRGDVPHQFEIHVLTKKADDVYGSLAEELRDAISETLDATIPLYDFAIRAAPVLIGNNFKITLTYMGSTKSFDDESPLSTWTMTFEGYTDRGSRENHQ